MTTRLSIPLDKAFSLCQHNVKVSALDRPCSNKGYVCVFAIFVSFKGQTDRKTSQKQSSVVTFPFSLEQKFFLDKVKFRDGDDDGWSERAAEGQKLYTGKSL